MLESHDRETAYYRDAPTEEVDVWLGDDKRPGLLITPTHGSRVLLIHAPCSCGEDECTGITFSFEIRDFHLGALADVSIQPIPFTESADVFQPFTAENPRVFHLSEYAEPLAAMNARETDDDYSPSDSARRASAALDANEDVAAWKEDVDYC